MTPEVKAFDPGNRLTFMTGPLLATGAQGAARMSVSGKSPMAYPEGYCYGSMGGHFPAEIKKAGWDGIDAAELGPYAERIFNMQRLIRVREGHRVPEDDFPPEFNFTEPLMFNPHGGKMIMPGPGARPVDMTGNVLDRDKFVSMLKEYYQLRGWEEKTGLPTRETLTALGMEDLIKTV